MSLKLRHISSFALAAGLCLAGVAGSTNAAEKADKAPVVTKVEPPNWWVGLTPEMMVLLSGSGLDANKVECNLSSVVVERTQATAGGNYLFVWLKFGADLKMRLR